MIYGQELLGAYDRGFGHHEDEYDYLFNEIPDIRWFQRRLLPYDQIWWEVLES